MGLFSNAEFYSQLSALFEKVKTKGSLTYTLKRVRVDENLVPINPKSKTPVSSPTSVCLIRVSLDKKTISTLVSPLDKLNLKFSRLILKILINSLLNTMDF
ncbi:RNA-binding signal recognition particle subunit srp14, variant 2 [Entomophthora muscae]|uniref:RNA-binding signal recognition particle subunit srp14, variant 2 n=1 Tax=Entomophthora muscae TaxID=34485 RepID=A0ACC2SGQ9_9FUNG|nr:RNA-binding signal recognition particle subunit srp14, variant 2 [Entomophthora muscae]